MVQVEQAGFGRVGRRYERPGARPDALIQQGFRSEAWSGLGGQANDAFSNPAARMGYGTPSVAENANYEMVRWSNNYWLLLTLYRNHWISRRIVDAAAQDMVRAWPVLNSEIEPDDIDKFEDCIRRTRTKSELLKTLKWARLYGGAGALIVIDGHEKHLDEPLDLDTVGVGAYRGLIPFDRWISISPDTTEINTDLDEPTGFGLPKYYRVMAQGNSGFRVHSSRILRFIGPEVPQPELAAQMYWGISVLEPVFDELKKRDNLSSSILNLTFRAQIIAQTNPDLAGQLSGLTMSADALQRFTARMQAQNELLSNQSMLVLPKDGSMQNFQCGAFTGLSDVYQQFQMDISGAAEIPMTRLFGRTMTGIGQSNDADERIYEEKISQTQEDQLRPQLDKLFPVVCMSEFGEVPDDLDYKFPSVRVLTEEEKTNLAKNVADSVVVLYNAGIMDKPQAMKEVKQSSATTNFGTNFTDEDIEKAEEEQEQLDAMPLVAPGMPGQPGDPTSPDAGASGGATPPAAQPGMNPQAAAVAGVAKGPQAPKPGPQLVKKPAAAAKDSIAERSFNGVPVTVEVHAGDYRTIRNSNGAIVYDRKLRHHYGFVRGTVGRDGDEIDCILGPDEKSNRVFVADMIDRGPDVAARSNEDKVLFGFNDPESAKQAFLSMYPADFLGGMEEQSIDRWRKSRANDAGVSTQSRKVDVERKIAPAHSIEKAAAQPRSSRPTVNKIALERLLQKLEQVAEKESRDEKAQQVSSANNPMSVVEISQAQSSAPIVWILFEDGKIRAKARDGYESFARGVLNSIIPGEDGEKLTAVSSPEKWLAALPGCYSGIYLRARIVGDATDEAIEAVDEFEEAEHPRVKSGQGAGEFAPKGGGGGAAPKAEGDKPKEWANWGTGQKAAWTRAQKAGAAKAAVHHAAAKEAAAGAKPMHGKAALLLPAPAKREDWPAHIRKMVLPPAWTDVRISMDPQSDLQAMGKDAKGRPQYVYSERFKNSQAAAKFKRVAALDKKFETVKASVDKGEQSKDERVREHAQCLKLIMATGVRPGSEHDTKAEKQAYGATTLLGKHIVVGDKNQVVMKFTGKKGVDLALPVDQPDVAGMLRHRAKAAGPDGKLFPEVSAHSLLAYTKSVGGDKFKSKDFRTLLASHLAIDAMKGVKTPENAKEYKAAVKQVAVAVSERLGNTPTVALQAYIPPVLFGAWREHAGV